MDAETRRSYQVALRQAQRELGGLDKRADALRQTIEALQTLLAPTADVVTERRRPPVRRARIVRGNHPPVRSDHFKGMGPTSAYRKFVAEFGADHPVPGIRDALLAGGVRTKSSASLLTGLHSVRRRDAMKEKAAAADNEKEAAESKANGDK